MARTWGSEKLPDIAWRSLPGLTKAERAQEQNQAAGGHDQRIVILTNGRTATASVCLRQPAKARRVYAYLRWSIEGTTDERYIGEVQHATRAENLTEAWRIVRDRELTSVPAPVSDEDEGDAGSWASSPAVRAVMRANKNKDTKPELRLRSAAHALGLRYRVGTRPLPAIRRTADLVFPRVKVAVFLDGCFWHGCPDHHRPAKRNSEFWASKIEGNRARDRETNQKLSEAGWAVIRIWEHEDPVPAAEQIAEVVRERASQRRRQSPGGRISQGDSLVDG